MYKRFGIIFGQSLSASAGPPSSLIHFITWQPLVLWAQARLLVCSIPSPNVLLGAISWLFIEFRNYSKTHHMHSRSLAYSSPLVERNLPLCEMNWEIPMPCGSLQATRKLCSWEKWKIHAVTTSEAAAFSEASLTVLVFMLQGRGAFCLVSFLRKWWRWDTHAGHPVSAFRNHLSSWRVIFSCEIKL